MKKIAAIFLLISMLFLVTSCDISDIFQETEPDDQSQPGFNPDGSIIYAEMTDSDYDKISELHSAVGNKVAVSVITENLGAILKADYAIDGELITYTVEKLNMLPSDGDINKLPDSMISTYTGTAHINENGELVDDSDGEVALPEGTALAGNMDFSPDNFENGKRSPYGFEGNVKSVQDFLGVDLTVNSMSVKVDYTDSGISTIVLNYTKGSAKITITYKF